MDIDKILQQAVDKNILVYDSAAESGIFTKRLVKLMANIFKDTYCRDHDKKKDLLDKILVPENVWKTFSHNLFDDFQLDINGPPINFRLFNIDIIWSEDYTSRYFDIDSVTLYKGDQTLVIGIGVNDTPILGSF